MSAVTVAAGVGAAWGLAGYAVLWGYTPLFVTRSFVVSAVGTLALLPVRAVLAAVHFVEEHVAGRSFDLSRSHGWIAFAAAAIGAAIATVLFLVARAAIRRARAVQKG